MNTLMYINYKKLQNILFICTYEIETEYIIVIFHLRPIYY